MEGTLKNAGHERHRDDPKKSPESELRDGLVQESGGLT
jgi:hypothetical protein